MWFPVENPQNDCSWNLMSWTSVAFSSNSHFSVCQSVKSFATVCRLHLHRIADISRPPLAASRFYQKLIWRTTQTRRLFPISLTGLSTLSGKVPQRACGFAVAFRIQFCKEIKNMTTGWVLMYAKVGGSGTCAIDNAFCATFSLSRRTQAPCQVSVMKR